MRAIQALALALLLALVACAPKPPAPDAAATPRPVPDPVYTRRWNKDFMTQIGMDAVAAGKAKGAADACWVSNVRTEGFRDSWNEFARRMYGPNIEFMQLFDRGTVDGYRMGLSLRPSRCDIARKLFDTHREILRLLIQREFGG